MITVSTSIRIDVKRHLKRWGAVCLCAYVGCSISGCVRHRVVRDGWAPLRALADTPADPTDSRSNRSSAGVLKEIIGPAETVPLDVRAHSGMYTLQIGYYDDAFGPNFRNAAVKAAQTLREEGDPAYFYHGPHRSMVTVGLFTDDDLVQQGFQRVYGPNVKTLQEKYPYNLGNGRTVVERINGEIVGEQSSFLVRIP